jgi:hypothetical protein
MIVYVTMIVPLRSRAHEMRAGADFGSSRLARATAATHVEGEQIPPEIALRATGCGGDVPVFAKLKNSKS